MPVYGLKKVAFSPAEKLGFSKNRKGDVKKMERLKNVYKITAKTEKSEGMEKYIFSHTPDNAAKKMRVYLERKGEINAKIMHVEQVLKDVIY